MIKDFKNFLGKQELIKDTIAVVKKSYSDKGMPIDKGFKIIDIDSNNLPKGEYEAVIYIMPDDSVEIRTIDKGDYIHGIVVKLTGDDVRDDRLHRLEWKIVVL